MKKGTFTTLQSLKPDVTDFSKIGQSVIDNEIKANAEARAEDDLQLRKDNAQLAKNEAKRKSDKAFEEEYGISTDAILKTNFNSYDEVMLPYVDDLRSQLWETKAKLRENPTDELKQKFRNLETSVKTVKASNEAFSGILTKISELDSKGGISGVHSEKWMDMLQKYKDFNVTPHINRRTGRTEMMYVDKDGKTVVISLQDMINGGYDIYGKQDVGKFAGSIADRLGVRKKDSVSNRFINTEVNFSDVKESARLAIIGELTTDEKLADYLNQANGSMKDTWDVTTEEGKKEREKDVNTATEYLLKQVEGSYDTQSTLKERSYAPLPRAETTASVNAKKEIATLENRNLTLANAKTGKVSQLVGQPAFTVDSNGKQITTVIRSANVVGDELILSLAVGEDTTGDGIPDSREEIIVDVNDKRAMNEVWNKATGKRVDSDKLGALADTTAKEIGNTYTRVMNPIPDKDMSFINDNLISDVEEKVVPIINERLGKYGITAEQSEWTGDAMTLRDKEGNSIVIQLDEKGDVGKVELDKLRTWVKEHATKTKGFKAVSNNKSNKKSIKGF